MSSVIPFPIKNSELQAASIGGLSTPELRQRAWNNHYTADRRRGFCATEAYERADAFMRDMDRINARFEVRNA